MLPYQGCDELAFPSLHRLPADVGSPVSSVLWKAPTSVSPSRRRPCDRSATIPWLIHDSLAMRCILTSRPDRLVTRLPKSGLFAKERTDLPSSQGSLIHVPGSQTPVDSLSQVIRHNDVAFRK